MLKMATENKRQKWVSSFKIVCLTSPRGQMRETLILDGHFVPVQLRRERKGTGGPSYYLSLSTTRSWPFSGTSQHIDRACRTVG